MLRNRNSNGKETGEESAAEIDAASISARDIYILDN